MQLLRLSSVRKFAVHEDYTNSIIVEDLKCILQLSFNHLNVPTSVLEVFSFICNQQRQPEDDC